MNNLVSNDERTTIDHQSLIIIYSSLINNHYDKKLPQNRLPKSAEK